MIREYLADYFSGLNQALGGVSPDRFEELVCLLESAYHEERQVFLFGNGGSGATASHLVVDFNKGVGMGLEKRFRVMCLNDSVPTLTACANDFSYQDVFVEPLKNFVRPGDLVIGISGSGNSPNVLKAIDYANSRGAHTVGLTGFSGGNLAALARTSVHVPVNDMQKAEDAHLILLHAAFQLLCKQIRNPEAEGKESKATR